MSGEIDPRSPRNYSRLLQFTEVKQGPGNLQQMHCSGHAQLRASVPALIFPNKKASLQSSEEPSGHSDILGNHAVSSHGFPPQWGHSQGRGDRAGPKIL